jgi:hypothetical protein
MFDNRNIKPDRKQANPGKIVALGAVATALALINLSTGTEAHSTAVKILEYAALAGGLIALVGGLIIMMQQRM